MTTASYAPSVTAKAIQVLIIQPDDTYELRTVSQELREWQDIVGGYIEDVHAEGCVIWADEEGKLKNAPMNALATFLWWNLRPDMEGKDVLTGTVFITGDADGEWSEPVPQAVIEFFEKMRAVYMEHKDD